MSPEELAAIDDRLNYLRLISYCGPYENAEHLTSAADDIEALLWHIDDLTTQPTTEEKKP